MQPTQTGNSQIMLEKASEASSVLANILEKRQMTNNPDLFMSQVDALANEVKQKMSLAADTIIEVDIADPMPKEEKGKWHPHIRIQQGNDYGNAYLLYDLPEE